MNKEEYHGLTSNEVNQRIKEKKTNKSKRVKGKSHFEIIFTSIFTFFNIILFVLAIIFLIVQLTTKEGIKYIPVTKYGFLLVILLNALSSIISQEASKRTLEKMRLMTMQKVVVIRDETRQSIRSEDIVLDDVIYLKSGDVVPCDVTLLSEEVVVNESMLTGESEGIKKEKGDTLYGGSYLILGDGYFKATKVGNETYIAQMESKVGAIKKKKSQLMLDIYKFIKILFFLIVPAVFLTWIKTFYLGDGEHHWVWTYAALTKPATVLVGMIPIGMILLTSITLSKSIISLYKKKTMVQELYAIENLSRIDTICLDKTGTLTTQNFTFERAETLSNSANLKEIMPIFIGAFSFSNPTLEALKKEFGGESSELVKEVKPFSSEKKYSRVLLKDARQIILGAPEYVLKTPKNIKKAQELSKDGYRVLALNVNDEDIALFLLKDEKRKNVNETLEYFDSLDVDIKIISGDNALTVKQIAGECGVKNADKYISMENVEFAQIAEICDQYTVFARTSPEQKQEIIRCLERKGHKVAYVGDGVNDTQSLRQADCSIALASGASSTKAVSDVVLLDDDFSHLPSVLQEGRKVVNNIERTVLLFLTKSFFIGLFSLVSFFFPKGLPIEIEAIYVYEFVVITFCGLLLSLQNNKPEAINHDFVKITIKKSVMYGLFMTLSALVPIIFDLFLDMPSAIYLVPLFISIAGIFILLDVVRPFNKYTLMVFLLGIAGSVLFLLALPNVFLNPEYLKSASGAASQMNLIKKAFFDLSIYRGLNVIEIVLTLVFIACCYPLFFGLDKLFSIKK